MHDPTPQSSGLEIERLNGLLELAAKAGDVTPTIDDLKAISTILTRLQSLEVENARLLGEVERPSEPGGFTGDIFFGDPRNSTRGTHRWDGAQWAELPSEGETLMLLLAEARAQRDTWRKTAERMVEEPDALAAALARADAAEAALALAREGLEEARRAIGDHWAPNDCYATGPVTGNAIRDLVECPACSFIAMHDELLSTLDGEVKS